jgi:hypothetical protein
MSAFDLSREIATVAERNPTAVARLLDAAGELVARKEMPAAIRSAGEISRGIPPLREDGLLGNGIHLTNWPEVMERFAFNEPRQILARGMLHAAHDLRETGRADRAWLGGTYFSAKEFPGDFDMTYDAPNQQALFDIYNSFSLLRNRRLTHLAYGGDVLPNLKDYFQQNDRTGKTMGILELDFNTLAPRPDRVSPAIKALKYESSLLFEFEPRLVLAIERLRTLLGLSRK